MKTVRDKSNFLCHEGISLRTGEPVKGYLWMGSESAYIIPDHQGVSVDENYILSAHVEPVRPDSVYPVDFIRENDPPNELQDYRAIGTRTEFKILKDQAAHPEKHARSILASKSYYAPAGLTHNIISEISSELDPDTILAIVPENSRIEVIYKKPAGVLYEPGTKSPAGSQTKGAK